MSHALNGNIHLLSPVLITGALGDANIVRTMDYIPGNVLRGLFASRYIHKKKQDKTGLPQVPFHYNDVFFRWFLKGELSFTGAYLTETNDGSTLCFKPVSLSFHQNKTQTRIYNLLDEDPKQTKAIGGYAHISGERIITSAPNKKIRFHHVREDRLKGHSKDGGIFNYETLEKDQNFTFRIIGREEALQEFHAFFGDQFESGVGRSRSTEYGQVKVALLEIQPIALRDSKSEARDSDKLIITFISPAVFYNEHGYPDASPDNLRNYLQNALGVKLEIKRRFAKVESVENFVGVWKMKKPLDQAIQAGSTFEICFAETNELAGKLESLSVNGLGERTNEGYGQFEIMSNQDGRYSTEGSSGKGDPERPKGAPPKQVKEIVLETIKAQITQGIETLAISHAKSYHGRKPSNSLLGRLELMAGAIRSSERFSEEFASQVGKLRPLAEGQLQKCYVEKSSLFELLSSPKKQKEILPSFYVNQGDIKELAELIQFEYEEDAQLRDDMLRKYWLTFFRRLRKQNREEVTHDKSERKNNR
ncbi:MAG: hypothetical protein DDT32_00640 [Syntrophomonadaceae bacterium]|nr:hypothetical protein [Bacillota bacterium]